MSTAMHTASYIAYYTNTNIIILLSSITVGLVVLDIYVCVCMYACSFICTESSKNALYPYMSSHKHYPSSSAYCARLCYRCDTYDLFE